MWHDNTGQDSSSSWFLKNVILRDLQTMEKYHFICQQWFAVEKVNYRFYFIHFLFNFKID
jgi:hypothetical protein